LKTYYDSHPPNDQNNRTTTLITLNKGLQENFLIEQPNPKRKTTNLKNFLQPFL